MTTTKQLGYYASQVNYDDLPEQTVTNAKKCILDWAGVCIRGAQENRYGFCAICSQEEREPMRLPF